MNWSTRETVASFQLPVTALFSLVEVLRRDFVASVQVLYSNIPLPRATHHKKTQGFPTCGTLWRCITELVSIH